MINGFINTWDKVANKNGNVIRINEAIDIFISY